MEDLIDNQQRETFVAGGEAPNVLVADQEAWHLLESCLGRDPVAAWKLTKMSHACKGPGYLEWTATFERDPEYPVPPIQVRQLSEEEIDAAVAEAKKQDAAASGKGPRS